MRILLVDDDTGVIQSLLPVLKNLPGVEVRAATSGEKAIENAAAAGGIDLLITDVVMEPMDGFTLRDEITTRFPGVRTILISGYDLSEYPEQTQNHQLLSKPIDPAALRAAIESEFSAPPPAPEPVPPPAPVAVPVARPSAAPAVTAAAQPVPRAASAPSPAPTAVAVARPASPGTAASAPPSQPRAVAAPQATAVPRPTATPSAAPVPRAVAAPQAAGTPAIPVPKARPAQPTASPAPMAAPRAAAPTAAPRATAAAAGINPPKAAPGAPVPVAAPRAVPVARPASAPAASAASVPETLADKNSEPPNSEEPAQPSEAASLPPPQATPSGGDLVGQTVGAYQILRHLGEGRWGSVYAAVQVSINRPVGLKVLDKARANDAAARDRFIADARAKARVQHPSILAVYEAGEFEGYIFYAHEYVDGRNMAEIRQGGQPVDEVTALKVMRVAAEGLAYLSINHLPHSILLPSHVFLSADGNARLANLATQLPDSQLSVAEEIQTLGRMMLGVLPPFDAISSGLRQLLQRLVQPGGDAITAWGQLLQGIKALEPKVVPVEAAKITAQDRAAVAAVEKLRKQQKRSLYLNVGSVVSLLLLGAFLVWKFFGSNERSLDDQVKIPAGEFIFAAGQSMTLPDFWIDKYEVTYGQYAKFVQQLENHPASEYDDRRQPPRKTSMMHKPEHWEIFYGQAKVGGKAHSVPIDLNCPVMEVDWWDAYAYAKWKGRELPTEQEWEKAARGTRGFLYPWGENPDPKKVNSNADFNPGDPGAKGKVDGFNFWNPVDAIKGDKSPFGVIGMAGNVREWTGSWDSANKHPIIKGGSYMSTDVRLDQRTDTFEPSAYNESLGFRTISRNPPK